MPINEWLSHFVPNSRIAQWQSICRNEMTKPKSVKTTTSNKPSINMKTMHQIDAPPDVASSRSLDRRPVGGRLASAQRKVPTTDNNAIRPFQVNVPESELTELRRRINATRWPDRETVTDATQGVQLATTRALARYWATEYDWRKVESRLNALPNFITEIDGLDIHFIHVRSKHENALPLIVTHGWPGSIIEQLKIIDLLA